MMRATSVHVIEIEENNRVRVYEFALLKPSTDDVCTVLAASRHQATEQSVGQVQLVIRTNGLVWDDDMLDQVRNCIDASHRDELFTLRFLPLIDQICLVRLGVMSEHAVEEVFSTDLFAVLRIERLVCPDANVRRVLLQILRSARKRLPSSRLVDMSTIRMIVHALLIRLRPLRGCPRVSVLAAAARADAYTIAQIRRRRREWPRCENA